jgi:hypothetical protein
MCDRPLKNVSEVHKDFQVTPPYALIDIEIAVDPAALDATGEHVESLMAA